MPTRSMSASGGNADIPDNPHQCPLMTHCGYGGATSQLAVPDFSFTPMSGFSPEACFRTYISGAFWDRSLILERFQVRCQRADGCADSDERTTFCPAAWQGQGCKLLRLPQIESGDIVSGLTAGHQVGNKLPGHGRHGDQRSQGDAYAGLWSSTFSRRGLAGACIR